MKIKMQTLNTLQSPARYRYVKVRNGMTPGVKSGEEAAFFLYIGRSVENFDLIREELGNGWMVADLGEAEKALQAMRTDACRITAVFLDDPAGLKGDFSALRRLRLHQILKHSAIIANMRGLSTGLVSEMRNSLMVDELVDFRVETALLAEKIAMINDINQAIHGRQHSIRPEHSPHSVYGKRYLIKRFVDLVAASLLLVASLPVFLLIALAVKIESRGPVFYNSYRAGRGYRIFKFFKFRTMKVGAHRMIQSIAHLNKYNNFGHAPVFFKADNDPRITRVGQFLRSSGLDELPQLFNVLIGDMSIVGNRPLPLYEASALTNNEWAERFAAPAGITGLWQVTCRSAGHFTTGDRILKDLEYARNNSFVADMSILLKTPVVLVKGMIKDREKDTYSRTIVHPVFKAEFSQL